MNAYTCWGPWQHAVVVTETCVPANAITLLLDLVDPTLPELRLTRIFLICISKRARGDGLESEYAWTVGVGAYAAQPRKYVTRAVWRKLFDWLQACWSQKPLKPAPVTLVPAHVPYSTNFRDSTSVHFTALDLAIQPQSLPSIRATKRSASHGCQVVYPGGLMVPYSLLY